MLNKKCLFTGGGSVGHVSTNMALIPLFLENNWEVVYVGSHSGIERELISQIDGVMYFPISVGKFRRYFSWQNLFDFFKIVVGIFQAFFVIRRNNVNVIFSKGGFVSFPVILGGWLNGVPIIMHESDLTPGLANRLSVPFSSKIFTTFKETEEYISLRPEKVRCVGPVIRESLRNGDVARGRSYCGFSSNKPILLVMGGSLGAKTINLAVRSNLDELLKDFQIVHLCGRNQLDTSIKMHGYKQFEFVDKELADVIAMSDLVLSRAGSNAIFEFLALRKPMLLVPLPMNSSRGDQIANAEIFRKKGLCNVVTNESLGVRGYLVKVVRQVYSDRSKYLARMDSQTIGTDCHVVFEAIVDVAL